MRKNDKVIGVCENYTHEGFGVVKVNGFPLFVKGMLQGEKGELIVTFVKKSFGFAHLRTRLKTSPKRVTPPCPIANQCGGCQLQHMHYDEQLRFKKEQVQNAMQRIAKLTLPIHDVIGMNAYENYRNKGQIPVGLTQTGDVVTGFYRIHTNDIVNTDTCRIQSTKINEVLRVMRTLFKNYQNANVFRHLLIKHAFVSNEIMVVWIVRTKSFVHKEEMKNDLLRAIPEIKSVILNINTRTDNVILGETEELLYGTNFITDALKNLKFHISSKSFYQVNPAQTQVLYERALSYCKLTGHELVIDLYCGVGTISMFLAQQAKKVIGIEIIPQAIQDAKENALLNGLHNIEFICSDAATYAKELCKKQLQPDVIVIDPPRKGCDEETLHSIVQMRPSRIVYISCDVATLARDLHRFTLQGYQAEELQPVDMFPFSFHIETIAFLQRK